MKKFNIIILMLFLITGCQGESYSADISNVVITSAELFDEDNQIAKVHINPLTSEYVETNYSGDKIYDMEWQIWQDGELQDSTKKILGLELNDIEGFSFIIREMDDYIDVEIGNYNSTGQGKASFPIEVSVDDNLLGMTESTYYETVRFKDTEDIILWGYHRFENGLDVFEDSREAVQELEWSLVFVLTPSDGL